MLTSLHINGFGQDHILYCQFSSQTAAVVSLLDYEKSTISLQGGIQSDLTQYCPISHKSMNVAYFHTTGSLLKQWNNHFPERSPLHTDTVH